MVLCCLVDNEIVVCSVCQKSAGKTKNELTIAECKQWYVKRGDPIYCKKCLVNEKIRLKQELETLKAINAMQNKKKTSKLKLSLRTIKDGKAWKKSDSFVASHKPSPKVLEQTKRAEKRAQSKKDIKQNRKENFSYDLRKELEVRRKLGRIERLQEDGERSNNLQKRRRSSIVEFFKKIGSGGPVTQPSDAGEPRASSETGGVGAEQKVRRRRRSSIVEFFKKFAAPKMPNRKSGFKGKANNNHSPSSREGEYGVGVEQEPGEECIITPVNSNPNTPRHSFDQTATHEDFADVLTMENESVSIEDTLESIGEQGSSLRESFCSDQYEMGSISEDSSEVEEMKRETKRKVEAST